MPTYSTIANDVESWWKSLTRKWGLFGDEVHTYQHFTAIKQDEHINRHIHSIWPPGKQLQEQHLYILIERTTSADTIVSMNCNSTYIINKITMYGNNPSPDTRLQHSLRISCVSIKSTYALPSCMPLGIDPNQLTPEHSWSLAKPNNYFSVPRQWSSIATQISYELKESSTP